MHFNSPSHSLDREEEAIVVSDCVQVSELDSLLQR